MIAVAEKLPRGRHGLSRDYVAASQFGRLAAAIDGMILRGPAPTMVRAVGIAGVSRKAFYQFWPNIESAVAARAAVLAEQQPAWPGRVGELVVLLLSARVGVMEGNIERAAQRLVSAARARGGRHDAA